MNEPVKVIMLLLSACYVYGWVVAYTISASYLKLPGLQFILSIPHELCIIGGFYFFLFIMVTLFLAALILRPFSFRIIRIKWTTESKNRFFIRVGLIVGSVIYIVTILYFLVWCIGLSNYFLPFYVLLIFFVVYILFVRWYLHCLRRSCATVINTLLFVILTCITLALPPFAITTQLLPDTITPYKSEKLVVIRTKLRLNNASRNAKNGGYNTDGYLAGESVGSACYIFLTPDGKNVYLVPKNTVELISAKVRVPALRK